MSVRVTSDHMEKWNCPELVRLAFPKAGYPEEFLYRNLTLTAVWTPPNDRPTLAAVMCAGARRARSWRAPNAGMSFAECVRAPVLCHPQRVPGVRIRAGAELPARAVQDA